MAFTFKLHAQLLILPMKIVDLLASNGFRLRWYTWLWIHKPFRILYFSITAVILAFSIALTLPQVGKHFVHDVLNCPIMTYVVQGIALVYQTSTSWARSIILEKLNYATLAECMKTFSDCCGIHNVAMTEGTF